LYCKAQPKDRKLEPIKGQPVPEAKLSIGLIPVKLAATVLYNESEHNILAYQQTGEKKTNQVVVFNQNVPEWIQKTRFNSIYTTHSLEAHF
jgi:hypothetical protein